MTDWRSCSVVRDRDGDLWGAPNSAALSGRWNRIGSAPLKLRTAWSDELETTYGPITPVLDADGLPVAERDALVEWQEKVALAAGVAEDLRGEGHGIYLETDPDRAAEYVGNLRESANEHEECPVLCDKCEPEQWEWPISCPDCHGSGVAGPSIIEFLDGVEPDNLAHPGNCDYCAGDGRWHTSPHNLVTFDYAKEMEAVVLDNLSAMKAERDALAAAVERVRALHSYDDDWCPNCGQPQPCQTILALDEVNKI